MTVIIRKRGRPKKDIDTNCDSYIQHKPIPEIEYDIFNNKKNNELIIRYKKLDPNVPDLRRYSKGAAGIDLCTTIDIGSFLGQLDISTGIAIEIPDRWVGLLSIRSSISRFMWLRDGIGIIDSDYRGEIKILVESDHYNSMPIPKYSRIAQLVIIPCFMAELIQVNELSVTERNINGLGSTGI